MVSQYVFLHNFDSFQTSFISAPATITSAFNGTKIAIGSDFEILCKASGVPTPNVKLFHGAKEVSVSVPYDALQIFD